LLTEFDALRPRHGAMRFLIAPYGCPFLQKNRKIQERLPELPLFSFPSCSPADASPASAGHIKKRPVPWKPQRVHARVSVKCHRVPSFKTGDYRVGKVPINDPKHWRERAEKARAHAEQMSDPEARQTMLEIAEDYEKLARRAEQRLKAAGKID
jgi:hypothetical protein